ncbi:MAG: hypothetical protein CSA36_02310 [Draconibacterium sp.]|nr:MAG: hypothetical protein CSA36_02310 [Draconibacterium sp.]
MDDLVVFILTILVAVLGFVGQARKRNKNAAKQPTGSKQPDIWDLLESQINKEEPEAHEIEEAEQEDEVLIDEPARPAYQFEAANEGSSLIEDKPAEKLFENKQIRKQKRSFSLRKAVVYSEILKRKYI